MKIRSKMFAVIIIFSVLPVILVSFIINHTYNKNTEDEILESLSSSVHIYESTVESFFDQKKLTLDTISNITEVKDYILNTNENLNYYNHESYVHIKDVINSCVDNGDYIIAIDIVSSNNQVVFSSKDRHEKNISKFEKANKMKSTEYKGVVYSDANIESDTGKTIFSIGVPIYYANEYIGYSTMSIDLEYLIRLSDQSEFYKTGYISVIDSQNFSVASKGPYVGNYINEISSDAKNTFPKEWNAVTEKGEDEGFFSYYIDGIKKIAFYSNINKTGWYVVGNVNIDEVFAPLNVTSKVVVMFVFVILIFDAIAFFIYMRSITIPMKKMTIATEGVYKGDYSIRMEYDEDNELGLIAKTFNNLMDNIQLNTNKLKNLNNDFSILTSNIPGGMIRCTVDEFCELYFVSESFLKLMKCSREDLEYAYDGRYMEMIHPDDVDYVRDIVLDIKEDGDIEDIEYRIVRPDSSIIWVKDRSRVVSDGNGKRWMYTILIDITVDKMYQEEFKKSEERFSKIVNWSDNIIFEWDSNRGNIGVSDNVRFKIGYNPLRLSSDGKSIEVDGIFPEDKEKFCNMFDRIFKGELGIEEDVRFKKKPENTYAWFKVKVGALRTDGNKIYKVIGIIYNIDNIKNHENIIKGRRDSFTGFYTREGMQLVVDDDITESLEVVKKAVIIFDIRGFNHLKEVMGIKFSEAVISDIAGKLSRAYDKSDVIARISESRFAVFTKFAASKSMLIVNINEVMDTLKSIYRNSELECSIQVCVGVSRYPKDGETFEALYQKAETALFEAIEKGNGKYVIYEENEKQMD